MKVYTCFVSIISYFGPNCLERETWLRSDLKDNIFLTFARVEELLMSHFFFFFQILLQQSGVLTESWLRLVLLVCLKTYISHDLQIYEAGVSEHVNTFTRPLLLGNLSVYVIEIMHL